MPPFRAVLFGWHGSRPRHLRALAAYYEARGGDAVVVAPRTFRAMAVPDGWQREAARHARILIERDRADPRPWIVHAFSNAGFWSAIALIEALAGDGLQARFAGSVIDSAPGFPERVSFLFTARYASRAMMPALLESLGRPPRATHPWLTPPLMALLGLWHLLAPRQVRFMQSSLQRMRRAHRHRPLLAIWGGRDALVPASLVEAFLERAERDGVLVERLFFADGSHVRHLVEHRSEYFEAVQRFLDRALERV